MARIAGAEPRDLRFFHGLFTRFTYWITKRKMHKVIEPLRIVSHHPKFLWATSQMEQAMMSSHLVEESLKSIAEIRVATLVGCPF